MKPCSIPKASFSTFASGATQFVVHDAFEITWCAAGSYISSLTPSTSVTSGSVAGAEMTTFFAPASMCFCAPSRFGEEARRLEHDVDAEVTPRQRRRIALGEQLELEVPRAEGVGAERDLLAERAEGRVVAKQVRHRLRVAEVVRRDDLEVAAPTQVRTEEVAPDAPEAVDAYADLRHGGPPIGCPAASLVTRPPAALSSDPS